MVFASMRVSRGSSSTRLWKTGKGNKKSKINFAVGAVLATSCALTTVWWLSCYFDDGTLRAADELISTAAAFDEETTQLLGLKPVTARNNKKRKTNSITSRQQRIPSSGVEVPVVSADVQDDKSEKGGLMQTLPSLFQEETFLDTYSGAPMLKWNRQAVEKACPRSKRMSLRPRDVDVDVPGMILKTRDKSLTGAKAVFEEDGVLGPYRTSHSKAELLKAYDAMQRHTSSVFEAQKKDGSGREALHGKRDVLTSRCYAFDPICEKLAKDPIIIEKVKQVLGDDVIVWSMDAFGKKNGSIQPWHTDLEPYDRCYGKNLQIWLAVDQVTEKSTLEVVTKSHRMPSLTWLYPEHIKLAKTTSEKLSFERDVLLPCAKSFDPSSQIAAPVTQDGEYLLFHSNMWHAAEMNSSFRKAIRITYSAPDCQIGAVHTYKRPDLPPLQPIPSLPPVLLVAGLAHSFPENRSVTNNFLHLRDTKVSGVTPAQAKGRRMRLAKQPVTSIVRIWSPEMIKAKTATSTAAGNIKRTKALLLVGNTPLFETLELFKVHFQPFEAAHTYYDSHDDGTVILIAEGQIGVHGRPNTTLLPPQQHKLGPVPILTELSSGGVSFVDSCAPHNEIGGAKGGSYFALKWRVRDEFKVDADVGMAPEITSFQSPPLDSESVNGQRFFEMNNFAHLHKAVGFTCRCVHELHPDFDHEVLFAVEHIPEGITLYALPEQKPIQEGTVMFYPLSTAHGIEARETNSGKVVPYRSAGKEFSDVPRCMVIELWAK